MIGGGAVASGRKKITKIIEEETGGKSYKAHKYSLDNDRSPLDYGESDDRTFVWKRRDISVAANYN